MVYVPTIYQILKLYENVKYYLILEMIFLISIAMLVLSKIVAKTMLPEKLPIKYDIIKIGTWKIAISFDISMLKLTS